MRIGCGLDVHPFTAGRKLILGGEVIDYHLGLAGHSDADVLTHALCDALLGAAALGDIGQHFPPSDAQYKDMSSILLLRQVMSMLNQNQWRLVNADMTVVCEEPKIAPYASRIRRNLSETIGASIETLSLKGTTSEKLGFAGRGEGIAAMAVVLLER